MDSAKNQSQAGTPASPSPASNTAPTPQTPSPTGIPTTPPATIQTPSTAAPVAPDSPTNTTALVALILAIFGFFVWIILPIAAIIVGILALKKIKQTGAKGRGMAIGAIVTASLLLLPQLLLTGLFIYAFSHPTKNDTSSSSTSSSSSDTATSDNSLSSEGSSASGSTSNPLANSQADSTLQQDLIKAVAIKEKVAGRGGELEIVSVTKQPKSGSTYVENWVVKVDGVTTTYKITLMPSSGGGTDYAVETVK